MLNKEDANYDDYDYRHGLVQHLINFLEPLCKVAAYLSIGISICQNCFGGNRALFCYNFVIISGLIG